MFKLVVEVALPNTSIARSTNHNTSIVATVTSTQQTWKVINNAKKNLVMANCQVSVTENNFLFFISLFASS